MGVYEGNTGFWRFFYDDELESALGDDVPGVGKWMHFFGADDSERVTKACYDAVECGACHEAKLSTLAQIALHGDDTGVACFYIDGEDAFQHKMLLSYMLSANLFPRDKSGRLIEAGFKFDWQTVEGLYGDDIYEIVLSDFVDLDSGELI